jgi:hypothetical protein
VKAGMMIKNGEITQATVYPPEIYSVLLMVTCHKIEKQLSYLSLNQL